LAISPQPPRSDARLAELKSASVLLRQLTDWRDTLPLVRRGQNRETLHVAMAARRVAVTRCFELADPLFDAEEVRGSNPLAPTEIPGQRRCLAD
jgi:hypothetical protein